MPTLSDLLTVATKDTVLEKLVAFFRQAGFVTASWQPFTLLRHLAEFQSFFLGSVTADVANIAKGGYLDDAEGDWLTLKTLSDFDEDRKDAVFTVGTVKLTDTGGVGPVTINPDSYWFSASGSGAKRFRNANTAAVIVPLNGSVTLSARAEVAGAAYNVAASTLTDINPNIPGVTLTNEGDPSTGTWVTTQGVDEERDDALRQRCRDKWGTQGTGSHEGSYRYWATTASNEVTRSRVVADPATGTVAVTVAGPSGPISAAGLALVQAAVEANRPLCVTAPTGNAVTQSVPIAGTLYLKTGAVAADVKVAVQSAIDAYTSASDIGQTIYVAEIIAAIMGVDGVKNVALSTPLGDVSLASNAVAVPTYSFVTA